MRHAVIMAGGSGTRLWPLSRTRRPKQLLRLFGGHSLLQHARRRLAGLFSPENTWVIASADIIDLIANDLPDLPRRNLISEPIGRDTANAIGLTAHLLAQHDPTGTMAVFTADHLIEPQERFDAAIRAGLDAAESHPTSLVTFGVRPDGPHTGYGYVRRGKRLSPTTYDVQEFREKPTRELAEQFVDSGEYYWNSGMFAWTLPAILGELARNLPENDATLRELASRWWMIAGTSEAAERFASLRKISIDFGVLEKCARALVVEMDCRWRDLGSWTAVADTQQRDEHGNVAIGDANLLVDARGNIVVGEGRHLLVLLGVEDLIVAHSGDATIICRKHDEQRLRELVELRTRSFGTRYE